MLSIDAQVHGFLLNHRLRAKQSLPCSDVFVYSLFCPDRFFIDRHIESEQTS